MRQSGRSAKAHVRNTAVRCIEQTNTCRTPAQCLGPSLLADAHTRFDVRAGRVCMLWIQRVRTCHNGKVKAIVHQAKETPGSELQRPCLNAGR